MANWKDKVQTKDPEQEFIEKLIHGVNLISERLQLTITMVESLNQRVLAIEEFLDSVGVVQVPVGEEQPSGESNV